MWQLCIWIWIYAYDHMYRYITHSYCIMRQYISTIVLSPHHFHIFMQRAGKKHSTAARMASTKIPLSRWSWLRRPEWLQWRSMDNDSVIVLFHHEVSIYIYIYTLYIYIHCVYTVYILCIYYICIYIYMYIHISIRFQCILLLLLLLFIIIITIIIIYIYTYLRLQYSSFLSISMRSRI